ncbi:MAG: winged helix-turn-helix transcriptional regulator [Candidatus Helarchaeota archaeon]
MKKIVYLVILGIFITSALVIPLLVVGSFFLRLPHVSGSQTSLQVTYQNPSLICSDATTTNTVVGPVKQSSIFFLEGMGALAIGIGLNVYSEFFQPVESKIELQQNTRNRIYTLIAEEEGIHLREICRRMNKRMGVVQYHIYVLERAGIISSYKDGRYRRFFTNGNGFDTAHAALISLLKRPTTNKILTHVIQEQEISHAELASLLGISSQAITWHIKKIEQHDLIISVKEGKQKIYHLNPEMKPLLMSLLEIKN